MTRTMLEEIRREIQEKVLDKLRLRASAASPVDGSYALAAPSSYLIDLPPGRADQNGPEIPFPAVVVTMAKRSQGQEGSSAEILLQAVTYGPGITAPALPGTSLTRPGRATGTSSTCWMPWPNTFWPTPCWPVSTR